MKSKLLFLFITLSIKSYQQNVGFEWAKAVGYIGHSQLLTSPSNPAVTVDGFGHIYSSGSFIDTMFLEQQMIN